MLKPLSNREQKDLQRVTAHGALVSVVVGISDYGHAVFGKLKTCVNDAERVAKTLREVHQLNADATRLVLLTSKTALKPSKGNVIRCLMEAVANTNESDRLLFFFSGHGTRFKNDARLFLVPEDVWEESPEAMLDFAKISEIFESSPAREKYVILDACYSGPATGTMKGPLSNQSVKFVTEYIERTKGFTIIGSSSEDEPSHTRSPDPDLSLFTYYFCNALRGEQGALRGTQLTSTSIIEYLTVEVPKRAKSYQSRQTPSFKIGGSGVQVWADFTAILAPAVLDLQGSPIRSVELTDTSPLAATDVLTALRHWSQHQEFYIEGRVNDNLGSHLEETLGRRAANLIESMGWAPTDVVVEGPGIAFPSGHYGAEYKASNKKSGHLVETVLFRESWFGRASEIIGVLNALEIHPSTVRFNLKCTLDPASAIPGLKARGWKLACSLDDKVEMTDYPQRVTLTSDALELHGFVLSDLLGADGNARSARLAAGVFTALPQST